MSARVAGLHVAEYYGAHVVTCQLSPSARSFQRQHVQIRSSQFFGGLGQMVGRAREVRGVFQRHHVQIRS